MNDPGCQLRIKNIGIQLFYKLDETNKLELQVIVKKICSCEHWVSYHHKKQDEHLADCFSLKGWFISYPTPGIRTHNLLLGYLMLALMKEEFE